MMPMYSLWLCGLHGLHGLRCLLSEKRAVKLDHSLTPITWFWLLFVSIPVTERKLQADYFGCPSHTHAHKHKQALLTVSWSNSWVPDSGYDPLCQRKSDVRATKCRTGFVSSHRQLHCLFFKLTKKTPSSTLLALWKVNRDPLTGPPSHWSPISLDWSPISLVHQCDPNGRSYPHPKYWTHQWGIDINISHGISPMEPS